MTPPKILKTTWPYFNKFLTYHGLEITPTYDRPCIWAGDQVKISGYDHYNFLLDINLCLSNRPSGLVRDRTGSIQFPFQIQTADSWTVPNQNLDLETCFANRVIDIQSRHPVVNLCYSGGIDSTAMVVAWLKFSSKDTKIRVLYSLDSIKENIEFFLHLKTISHVELIDIGGNIFYDNNLDGIEICGGGGDDITASMDESFFKQVEWWGLQSSWKDLFWKKNPNQKFIDFCEKWFALSGRDITTVLQARWWFYVNKMSPYSPNRILQQSTNSINESFYNSRFFVAHFYHNIESLFSSPSWKSYKQSLKNFIYDYHPDSGYRDNKCKEGSSGAFIFASKSRLVKKTEEIFCLSDGTSIRTENLPFLSKTEYRNKYNNQLDYLFHHEI